MTALFLWPIPFLCLLLAHKAQGPFKATLLLRDLEGEPVFITSLQIFIFVFVCFFFCYKKSEFTITISKGWSNTVTYLADLCNFLANG